MSNIGQIQLLHIHLMPEDLWRRDCLLSWICFICTPFNSLKLIHSAKSNDRICDFDNWTYKNSLRYKSFNSVINWLMNWNKNCVLDRQHVSLRSASVASANRPARCRREASRRAAEEDSGDQASAGKREIFFYLSKKSSGQLMVLDTFCATTETYSKLDRRYTFSRIFSY